MLLVGVTAAKTFANPGFRLVVVSNAKSNPTSAQSKEPMAWCLKATACEQNPQGTRYTRQP